MPAFQSMVVTDRASTPVNTTLIPSQKDATGKVFTVAAADSTGAALTEKRFSISTRRTGDRIRTTLKYRVPVIAIEVINGVSSPRLMREAFVNFNFDFHKDSLESERNNVVGEVASALATGKLLVNDTIVKAQDIY